MPDFNIINFDSAHRLLTLISLLLLPYNLVHVIIMYEIIIIKKKAEHNNVCSGSIFGT